jgi:23S rRNA (uracil1939-C5)-methyltransferase
MRARLHVRGGRIGFVREGSHDLCDAEGTGQLLPETVAWIRSATGTLGREDLRGLQSIEIAENVPATERACHLEVASGDDLTRYAHLAEGLTGLSAQTGDSHAPLQLAGSRLVQDDLRVTRGQSVATLHLSREVRAFFQGNRYLLERIVSHVVGLVPEGPVLDLYAGVGLFGLSLAALGHDAVTLVEGDRVSSANLVGNAARLESSVRVERLSVEHFLHADRVTRQAETVIVDPPRTGLSPDALAGVIRRQPARLVYVSCDVATLARDARGLVDAGYQLVSLLGFDLFPNTAHVESVAEFVRV